MNAPHTRKPVRGFTLIEIAIVVAIMLTLLTLGLGLMNAQLSSTAYSVTKKRQEAIKDALISYLGANRRLPCPYGPTPGTVLTGQAPAQSGTPPACPGPALGVVPFATLGLSRETGEDGWGNLFSYRVYSDDPPPTCPSAGWNWGNRDCFGEGKDGINPPKVALQINDGTASSLTNVVAVVISHGANGLGAWAAQGTRNALPLPPCGEEARNATADPPPPGCTLPPNTYYKGERQENDDVVAYLTASDALQLLARQGTIKSATAKVNDDLQALHDLTLGYKAQTRTTIPGPPETSNCSSSVLNTPTLMLDSSGNPIRDPWGNLYVVSEEPSPSKFPICVCSRGSASSPPPSTCPVTPPTETIICKIILRDSFNSYLTKAGVPVCPP